jgi:hypothetical protein
MASFAFSLPILPGQEEVVRRIGEAVSGELQEEYEESRRRLGISEEKIWVQRTPIGQTMIVYWDTEDPQRTLRKIADSQDEFDKRFIELIRTAAPGINLSDEQPLSNELLFTWQAS